MKFLRLALLAGVLAIPPAAWATGQTPAPAPVAVLNAATASVSTALAPDASWWDVFEDPVLDDLIQRASTDNLDFKMAFDRLRQARALFQDASLDQFPRIASHAAYGRSDEQTPGFGTTRDTIESAELGFDAAWEIDLFGRVRHGVNAAHADARASEADVRGVGLTVMAEVARNYFELRGAQARLAVARQESDSQSETLRLTQVRFQVGQGDPVDVASARARLHATEATVPELAAAEAHARYRLAVLLGLRPGALDDLLTPPVTQPAPLAKPLPIGEVGTFLRRRPDVEAAEWRLNSQIERTGVATADLFPRVRITGFVGLLSGDVSTLFSHGAQAWSVSPTVTWPALDLGSAQARLRAQKARADEAAADYDQTVLRAIEDLENALVDYGQQRQRIVSLVDQVQASREAASLAHIRYKEGGIDFLVLLDAERTRLAAEDDLTAAETAANVDIVAVYKALGGGWG